PRIPVEGRTDPLDLDQVDTHPHRYGLSARCSVGKYRAVASVPDQAGQRDRPPRVAALRVVVERADPGTRVGRSRPVRSSGRASTKMGNMDAESIRSEIELRTSRSSGPGGQHAQKTETRVEAILDIEASEALTDAEKRRIVAKAGPVLRAVAQDERSQLRNRELAVQRLLEQLREAARVPRRRRPTAPTAAARERRL